MDDWSSTCCTVGPRWLSNKNKGIYTCVVYNTQDRTEVLYTESENVDGFIRNLLRIVNGYRHGALHSREEQKRAYQILFEGENGRIIRFPKGHWMYPASPWRWLESSDLMAGMDISETYVVRNTLC